MSLPDSFPKRFTITLGLDMNKLMDASITNWGRILREELRHAEFGAAEQIKDFRMRYRVFRYCGSDPGEGFVTDYHCNWVTTDDGTIQFLRMDMLPISNRCLDSEIGLFDGTYEEVEEDGETFVREVKKD